MKGNKKKNSKDKRADDHYVRDQKFCVALSQSNYHITQPCLKSNFKMFTVTHGCNKRMWVEIYSRPHKFHKITFLGIKLRTWWFT